MTLHDGSDTFIDIDLGRCQTYFSATAGFRTIDAY